MSLPDTGKLTRSPIPQYPDRVSAAAGSPQEPAATDLFSARAESDKLTLVNTSDSVRIVPPSLSPPRPTGATFLFALTPPIGSSSGIFAGMAFGITYTGSNGATVIVREMAAQAYAETIALVHRGARDVTVITEDDMRYDPESFHKAHLEPPIQE